MAAAAAAERKVLSFGDVLLRQGDVDLLRSPSAWLNDQLVAFLFQYVAEQQQQHPAAAASCSALVPGGAAFLLLNSAPSEAALIFEALRLHDKQLVVFAVNDNPDVTHAEGGSHWSCLAYHRPTNSFRHYDSCRHRNRSTARDLAGAAAPLVRDRNQAAGSTVQQPSFVEVAAMPQQRNGHDCGLFVCAVAQALCELCATQHDADAAAASAAEYEAREAAALARITSSSVAQLRQRMLGLIEDLAAEQQQQHQA